MALDEQKDNDEVASVGGLNFLVEKDLLNSYGEFNIDYVNDWLRRGFHITPNKGGASC